jgi:hypothetical protein
MTYILRQKNKQLKNFSIINYTPITGDRMTIKKIVLTTAVFGFAACNIGASEAPKNLIVFAYGNQKVLTDTFDKKNIKTLKYLTTIKDINGGNNYSPFDIKHDFFNGLRELIETGKFQRCTFSGGKQTLVLYEDQPSTDLCNRAEEAYNKLWFWERSTT